MNKQSFLFLFLLGVFTFSTAQKKKITLEEIWGGEFRTEYMDVLRSMNNGTQYTILNTTRSPRSSSLDKYDYETLQKVEAIVASRTLLVMMNPKYYWQQKWNPFLGVPVWVSIMCIISPQKNWWKFPRQRSRNRRFLPMEVK